MGVQLKEKDSPSMSGDWNRWRCRERLREVRVFDFSVRDTRGKWDEKSCVVLYYKPASPARLWSHVYDSLGYLFTTFLY